MTMIYKVKKAYIATYFDWSNYGAMLQAISLNHYLNSVGYDAYLINYKQEDLFPKKSTWKLAILHWLYFNVNRQRKKSGEVFVQKNTKMTHPFTSYEELKSLDEENNVFISGSDQVWHPKLCSPFFFLEFVSRGIKISYAASLGLSSVPSDKQERIKQYLRDFTLVSCREKSAQRLLEPLKLDNSKIQVHIDPIFLNEMSYWNRLEEPVLKLPKHYILVYAIYWNFQMNDMLKKMHEESNCPIVVVGAAPKTYANIRFTAASPGQFLYLVHHADEIVSSSFHGIAFSIFYNKKFHAILNPSAPDRIKDMLTVFFQNIDAKKGIVSIRQEEYENYQQILFREREKARDYLLALL